MTFPFILVVAEREMEERAVNVRRLGSQDQKALKLDAGIATRMAEATPPDLQRMDLLIAASSLPVSQDCNGI